MKNEAVLIFGTFNPVTIAHVKIGLELQKKKKDADIIYIPSSTRFLREWKRYDEENILSDEDRIDLLKKAVSFYGFLVDRLEIDQIVDGKTYNTANYFKAKYQKVYLCFGMDKVSEIQKWRFSNELLTENHFLICTRDNRHIEDVASKEVLDSIENFEEIPMSEETQLISSTQVRRACHNNDLESVRKYIPEVVYNYLKEKTL